MKKIGFLGGTFNPIHFGHLHLASEMADKHNLDEVWFCPAQINPFKTSEDPTPVVHRLNMVSLAIQGHSRFKLCDLEAKRQGVSYSVDTLRELIDQFKGDQFYLILGDDIAAQFLEWRNPEKIVEMVPLLVGSRTGEFDLNKFKGHPKIYAAIKKGMVQTRLLKVSSTQVRDRLHQGLSCTDFVPARVLDYIAENGLYLKKL